MNQFPTESVEADLASPDYKTRQRAQKRLERSVWRLPDARPGGVRVDTRGRRYQAREDGSLRRVK